MKLLATIFFSFLFLVCASAQTRNVIVNTNSAVVQPTNFWSADASNARIGLGLGSAATNPASTFQPSSLVLTNLASSNAVNLTNLRSSNIVGTVGLASNIVGIVAITNGGTGATNTTNARYNFGLGETNNVTLGRLTVSGDGDQATLSGSKLEFSSFGLLIEAEEQKFTESGSDIFWWDPSYIQFFVPIQFYASSTAATSRTNLGIPLNVLTNTTISNLRTAIGLGETNDAIFKNINVDEVRATLIVANPPNSLATNLAIDVDDGVLRNPDGINGVGLEWTDTNIQVGLPIKWLTNTHAATTRANLGIPLAALTNTNNSNFLTAIFGSGTNPVLVNTGGSVISPTNFWQQAPIQTLVQTFTPTVNATNNGANARNLYVYSMAPSVSGVTNTIVLPTNSATFDGDSATITHKGTTSTVTAVRQDGSATNFTVITNTDESVKFIREASQWTFYHNISYVEPIRFTDGSIEANKAESRTNLGLGFHALTNTNTTNFQVAIFQTNTAPTNAANFNAAVAWMEINIHTNGTTNSYRIPLYK